MNSNKNAEVHIANSVRLDRQSKVLAYANTHIQIGNNVYLRSDPIGYHTGMPFPTTLIADKSGALISIGANCRLNGVYIHSQKDGLTCPSFQCFVPNHAKERLFPSWQNHIFYN